MPGLPWFRLYHETATDPKVQMMSEANQRRYIMLLCLRCCNEGVTLHDSEVAFQLRITDEEYAETKSILIERNLINPDNTPKAWDKRQRNSDSSAARVARHRKKKKQYSNVTGNTSGTKTNAVDTEADKDTELDTDDKDVEPSSSFENPWSIFEQRLTELGHDPIRLVSHRKQFKQWHEDGVSIDEFQAAIQDSERSLANKGDNKPPPVKYIANVIASNRKQGKPVSAGAIKSSVHSGFAEKDYLGESEGFRTVGGSK